MISLTKYKQGYELLRFLWYILLCASCVKTNWSTISKSQRLIFYLAVWIVVDKQPCLNGKDIELLVTALF